MTMTVISLVLALAATVLAFIFIVPEKKRASLNKPLQILHDVVNFKFLIIEKIMQALYIFSTASVIIMGVLGLFQFNKTMDGYSIDPETWEYVYDYSYEWVGYYGLLLIIVGPIAIRIVYEFLMMSILLVKNVIQLNNKTKNENGEDADSVFNVPTISFPKKQEQPAPTYAPASPTQPMAYTPAQPVAPTQPMVYTPAQPVAPTQPMAPTQPTVTYDQPVANDQPKFCKVCGTPTVNGHCPQGHI